MKLEFIINNHKKICFFLFMIAVLHHSIIHCIEPNFSSDLGYQITTANNFIEGRGISVPYSEAEDLSIVKYEPLIGWPPGITFLYLAAKTLQLEIKTTLLIIEVLGILFFFSTWFFILEHLSSWITPLGKTLLWAYWSILYSPIEFAMTSGLWSISFASLCLLFSLKYFRLQRYPYFYGSLAGAFMSFSSAIRYAYWPLLALVPILSLTYIYITKRKTLPFLFAYLSICTIIVGSVALFQKSNTGETTFLNSYGNYTETINTQKSTIHWDNIKDFQPYASYAFGFGDGFYKIITTARLPKSLHGPVVWFFFLFTLGLSLYWATRQLIEFYKSDFKQTDTFVITSFYLLVTGLTLSTLVYLSLKYSADRNGSFLSPLRYYIPMFPFLGLFIFNFLVRRYDHNFIHKSLKQGFIILITVCIAGLGVWKIKKISRLSEIPSHMYYYGEYNSDLQKAILDMRPSNPVLIGSYFSKLSAAIMYGTSYFPAELVGQKTLTTTQPIKVIVLLLKWDPEWIQQNLKKLVEKYQGVSVIKKKDYEFYTLTIFPELSENPVP